MKKIQAATLALLAIAGFTSAFASRTPEKAAAKFTNRTYGIMGTKYANGILCYTVVLWTDQSFCVEQDDATLMGTFNSDLTVSTVSKAAFDVTDFGVFYES